ncbi:MAG: ceramidase [Desulfobulbaceae bacterium]|nr:ceramidase [Desulfobulbaceae bacterium]
MKTQTLHISTTRHTTALLIITVVSGLVVGGLVWYGPIAQDPTYHYFADQRTLLKLPNFWNVVTNFPFVLLGLLGLHRCLTMPNNPACAGNRVAYILFFTGALLTGISSGYYHVQPDNWSLLWDRSSMTISFMAFLAIVIGAFVSKMVGRQLLAPLVLFGLFSVQYWIAAEQLGAGDLRLYVITQFLPILIIPLILYFWSSQTIKTSDLIIIGAGYGLAKLLESLDAQVFQLATISGHSLKHLAAAFSIYWLWHILGRIGSERSEPKCKIIRRRV